MEKLLTRQLGTSTGRCAACGETAPLRLVESRRRRSLRRALRAHFDASVFRTATCQRCFSTYPVRVTDTDAQASGRRDERDHRGQRGGRPPSRTGRDWAYPTAA